MVLREFIKSGEAQPLGAQQMIKFLGGNVNFVRYGEITSIESMLGSQQRFIMLYQFPGQKVGHWVCGFMLDGTLHLFDPYGMAPDEPSRMMGHPEMTKYQEAVESSSYYPDNVSMSRFPFQKMKDGIDTCGRHVLARLLLAEYDDQAYHELMTGRLLQNADERATLITLVASLPHE